MAKVTFDYSRTAQFISKEEVENSKVLAEAAKKVLVEKTGAGNDFLGWIDLPVDYDKEEFARIQKAAAKIQSDSEVLLVIGIGGSYLGARAAIEFLTSPNYNLLPKKDAEHLFCRQFHQRADAYRGRQALRGQGFQRQRHFEIRHNHRTGRGFPCIP